MVFFRSLAFYQASAVLCFVSFYRPANGTNFFILYVFPYSRVHFKFEQKLLLAQLRRTIPTHVTLHIINYIQSRFSNWINPRAASATRALLRLSPCHRAYLRPCLCRDFGYSRLPWLDGRWVQDLRTYSPQYSWPAITSNSNFMKASCSLQSELRPFLND